MTLRRDLISIIIISAIAFAPSLFISRMSNELLNSGVPNLISSVVTLALSGLIALSIYLLLGYRLQIAPITSVGDSVRKRLSRGN